MEDIIGTLVQAFFDEMAREGSKGMISSVSSFFRKKNEVGKAIISPPRIHIAGYMYFMNSNTLLYYNYLNNKVTGFSPKVFGNYWVDTSISLDTPASSFDGGYYDVHEYVIDNNGRYYFKSLNRRDTYHLLH